MNKLSKGFYLGSLAGGLVIAIALVWIGVSRGPSEGLAMIGIAWIPLLYVAVVMMVLFYKMWASIQDGHARTTPGKAIGFLFIPLFNLFWAFQAIWGFAKDYNSYVDRYSLRVPKLPEGLFLTYVILCFTAWIPIVGRVLVAINFFIGIAMVLKICDAVNALPGAAPAPGTVTVKQPTAAAPKTSGVPAATTGFKEKDNRGTRHDTLGFATGYWMARMSQVKKDPFVMYIFDNAKDAREALLELPCIKVAGDTENLICTEILHFGYYQQSDGKYEALICGDDLTHEMWEQAKASFAKHGGRRKNDLEPEKRAAAAPKIEAASPESVVFVREDRKPSQLAGKTCIYRVYKGPNAASARAFLEKNPVNKELYYIIVETPEGNYARDIQGMYKE